MFKVSHDGINYRISIGDGKPTKARHIEEVVQALRHYYAQSHKHTQCPFCTEIAS